MADLQIGKVTACNCEKQIEGVLWTKSIEQVLFFQVKIFNGKTVGSIYQYDYYAVLGPDENGRVWFEKDGLEYSFHAPLICKSPLNSPEKKDIENQSK